MDIPQNQKLYEHYIATLWFDDMGILYSVSKPGPRSIPIMQDYIDFVKNITLNKKVYLLTDISKAFPMDEETRKFSATHLPQVYNAMAIYSKTPLGNAVGKIFLDLESQPYPIKMFDDLDAARLWLSYQSKGIPT